LLILAYLLGAWYCPTFSAAESLAAPWWMYFAMALAAWLYQTLDAMDGKQVCYTPVPFL
jgi:hypothetical protein